MDPETLVNYVGRFALAGLGTLTSLLLWATLFYIVYFFFSLPLRRRERARLFLDLIEVGLKQGQSVEHSIIAASQSHDRMLGRRFHRLAAYMEGGLSLGRALERVRRLLPSQIVAMLNVGAEIGDLGKVLPACRTLLRDGIGQITKAHSYLVVLALVLAPLGASVLTVLAIWIFPKLNEVALGMGVPPPSLLAAVNEHRGLLVSTMAALQLVFYLGAVVYIGGPRLLSWLGTVFLSVLDRLFYRIPWKRKRMQRDFSTMLALLLDAGVTEERAVKLAAKGTDNAVFIGHAAEVTDALSSGVKLTEAVARVDDSGEFRWRLKNAVHSRAGFLAALAGWHETLDAKAFQQEQAAAHVITTAVVFVKGLFVGLIAVSIFQFLIAILNESFLW